MASKEEIERLIKGCESEKLHEIGQVQPDGVLLSGAKDGSVIRAISANSEKYLGHEPGFYLNASLPKVLPDVSFPLSGQPGEKQLLPSVIDGPNGVLDGLLSYGEKSWLLELEPAAEDAGFSTVNTSLHSLLSPARSESDWHAYTQKAVDMIQKLTGFDRIMLYQFLEDGSGEVTAEAGSGSYGSYLGLRFPASDIPRIARELYLKNPHRQIADVSAVPVPIVTIEQGAAPDLTFSDLRAVSPVHIEYLKNMEVGASLSFSIIAGGKLWGLFACHHRSARFLDYTVRSRCTEVTNAFSMGMMAYQSNLRLAYSSSVDREIERAIELIEQLAGDEAPLEDIGKIILDLVEANGAAIIDQGGIQRFGSCPTSAFIEDLDRWVIQEVRAEVFSTDCLAEHIRSGVDQSDFAAGVLSVQTSASLKLQYGNIRIYWFRKEVPQTVKWAGNPQKQVQVSEGQLALSPRNSFDLYLEETQYRSQRWSEMEIMMAKKFRNLLLRKFSRVLDNL